MQIFVTMEEKVFVTWQIQCRRYGGPEGPCSQFWFTENTFLETSCKDKKTADKNPKRNNNIQSFLLD